MLSKVEIRDREKIATLELLQVAVKLNDAHSKILMRHFSEARENLNDVKTRVDALLEVVPEEEDG